MRFLFTCTIIIFAHAVSFAQKFSASFDAQLALPQGDYEAVSADAGYGLRANVLYKPNDFVPVRFGIELGIMEKARATQYFSGNYYVSYDDFKVSATSNIVSTMFVTRFQSTRHHLFKPFIDLTAGWNVFFSTARIEDISYYSEYNPSYSNSSKAHWAFAYGAAGGIDISLNRRDDLGLELKAAYLIGSFTNYLTDPRIDGNGAVSFQQNNSRTNMLIPQAGIRISIR